MKYIIILLIFGMLACSTKDSKNTIEPKKDKINLEGEKVKELLTLEENQKLVAKINTTMGDIEIELFPDKTPKTVENFVGLATQNYYDGIIFHRVIDQFMIQGGDPTGSGSGGKSYFGGSFEDEFHSELTHNGPGILSMANAGPNTNGSQFFITLVPTPHLNGRHSVFGKVIKGLDVVKAIGKVETARGDKPVEDVVMKSVTIEKKTD